MLDTWFSSALWPFATLGWPDDTPELRAFYPTSFLTTAREILFLWVARMMMMGIEFPGAIPFRDVYVHSVIQARDGRRMSKSLGTGIDPLEEIDVHGADALRFGLLAMSSTQDVRYSDAKVEQGRDLTNKLWNASRLDPAERRRGRARAPPAPRRGPLDPLPPRAHDRLGHREARGLRLRPRRPGGLLVLLVGALRLVPGDRQAASLRRRGGGLGDAALGAGAGARPAAPADALRHRGDLVAPSGPRGPPRDPPVSRRGRVAVRPGRRGRHRGRDRADPPPARLARPGRGAGGEHPAGPRRRGRAAGVRRPPRPLRFSGDGGEPVAAIGPVKVLDSAEIDADAVAARLEKRREELRAEVERGERKLGNEGFVAKAPSEVVEEERGKLERYRAELEELG